MQCPVNSDVTPAYLEDTLISVLWQGLSCRLCSQTPVGVTERQSCDIGWVFKYLQILVSISPLLWDTTLWKMPLFCWTLRQCLLVASLCLSCLLAASLCVWQEELSGEFLLSRSPSSEVLPRLLEEWVQSCFGCSPASVFSQKLPPGVYTFARSLC